MSIALALAMASTILSPKASERVLQPTLTAAIRPAAATPPLLRSGTLFEASLSSSQPIT